MSLLPSVFPHPETADEHGIVAMSQTMTPAMLLDAYMHGIFPWTDNPILWFSPDPRAVFLPERVHIPTRVGRWLRQYQWTITYDQAFEEVMQQCAKVRRPHESSTWITKTYLQAYGELHQQGYAHSVEVWQGERLVGGLYGVQVRGLFAGESMFYSMPNASKVAFAFLWAQLKNMGINLLDAQVPSPFIQQLGAISVPRSQYLELLRQAMAVHSSCDGILWKQVSPSWKQVKTIIID